MIDHTKPKKNGRPRALNKEKKEAIVKLLSIGGSRKMAAKFVGVHYTTISDEAKRDAKFSAQLMQAEGKGYEHHLARIHKSEDWRASAWMLERKYPEEFARLEKHAMTDTSGHDLTPEQRKAAVDAIIAERLGK